MKTPEDLQEDIDYKVAELQNLKYTKRELEDRLKNAPVLAFVDFIHNKFCKWNHTDGCGYDYENWGNPRERMSWVTKTKEIIDFINENDGILTDASYNYLSAK